MTTHECGGVRKGSQGSMAGITKTRRLIGHVIAEQPKDLEMYRTLRFVDISYFDSRVPKLCVRSL
jgi:hypothetical protein